MSVSCANTMEIHTRWRCPPESGSTGRSRVSSMACSTASECDDDHCCSHVWCGCRLRATKFSTVTPGGVIGACGSMEIFCVSLAAEPLGEADSDVVVGAVDATNFALDKLVPQLEEVAPEA